MLVSSSPSPKDYLRMKTILALNVNILRDNKCFPKTGLFLNPLASTCKRLQEELALTWICCRWLWELKFSEEGSDTPAETAVAWVRTPVPSMVSGSWEALEDDVVVGT